MSVVAFILGMFVTGCAAVTIWATGEPRDELAEMIGKRMIEAKGLEQALREADDVASD